MNMSNIPRLTTLCNLERDGKYLILHRTKKAHDEKISTGEAAAKRSLEWCDKWIGVGGKFEYGESLVETKWG